MKSIAPNIFVKDINKTIEFYKNLGFDLTTKIPEKGDIFWAMMNCGSVTFMFQTFESLENQLPAISRTDGGSLLLYIEVDNVKELHYQVKDKVEIIKELEKTFYGAEEFSIIDINNYILTFAENEK